MDFEVTPFFDLTVVASDSLGLKTSQFIRIDLTNVVETTVITSPANFSILEDEPFSFQFTVQSESSDFDLSISKLPSWLQATADFQRIADGSLYPVLVGGATGGPPTNSALNLIGDFAILAIFDDIQTLDVDSAGNTFVYHNEDHLLYRINRTTGRLEHYGGDGTDANSGDGGQATLAGISAVEKLTAAPSGDVYLAISSPDHIIRKIDSQTGIISTVAGKGVSGFSGDGALAVDASLNQPSAVAVDNEGNIFIADQNNHRIRKVDAISNQISTIAGNGNQGLAGNGGPAVQAQLAQPTDLIMDRNGDIILADLSQIRRIDSQGIIDSIYNSGNEITGLAVDLNNDLAVTDGFALIKVGVDSAELLIQAGFGAQDVIQDVANDPFGNVTYSRSGTIQRSIQALTLEGTPDQDNVGMDTIAVILNEGSVKTTSEIFIEVQNINDAPIGQQSVVSLPEDARSGTLVHVLEASDQDGDTLTFKLLATSTGDNFEVDSSGIVNVKESGFDYETTPQYVLNISVADQNMGSHQFDLIVNITDVNEPPLFMTQSVGGIEIAENDPTGFTINTVASDDDGDPVSYQIVTSDLDTVFSVTLLDTLIQIAPIDTAGLNFESLSNENISLTLEARDTGGLADSLEINLTVLDVNEAPLFLDTIADQTVTANSPYSYVVDRELFDDPDKRAFLIPAVSLVILDSSTAPVQAPEWLSFQPSSLTLFGTPAQADTGLINLEFRLTDEGGLFGADTFALTILPDPLNEVIDTMPTGIGEKFLGQISVYPNPVLNRVHIVLEDPASHEDKWVKIIDLTGQIVVTAKMHHRKDLFSLEIDLAHLTSGIYLLAIQEGHLSVYVNRLQKE